MPTQSRSTHSVCSLFVPFLLTLSLTTIGGAAAAQTPQTATLVEDIATQEEQGFSSAGLLHPFGQSLFFVQGNPAVGDGAWMTDGTVSGTRMLADTCEGTCSFDSEILGTLGSRLVWLQGSRIWSTDGTPAGTTPLTDPDLHLLWDSYSTNSVVAAGRLFFLACRQQDFDSECAIWNTDGTRAGTAPVPILTPAPERDHVSSLASGGDRAYFRFGNSFGTVPSEIWTADAEGARPLLETPDGFYTIWATWKNLIFFEVQTPGEDQEELWVSDGTTAGTRSVGTFAGGIEAVLNEGPGGLYFVADDIVHSEEIWRTDGTLQGTRRMTEIGYFDPFYLFGFDRGSEGWAFEIDGRLLFAADDHLTGRRLWTSAGTPESTRPTGETGLGSRLYPAGNRLFAFRHDAAGQDCEVWSYDAQGKGTRLVDHLSQDECGPGTYWSNINVLTLGSHAYFSSKVNGSTWSIWRSDGTVPGTVRIASSSSYIGEVAATAGERSVYYTNGQGLWIWDARDGARQVVGQGLRNGSSHPRDLVAYQGKLAFTVGDGSDLYSRRIWSSQGSAADTSLFVDPADSGCAYPQRLIASSSALLFLCDAYISDDELRAADPAGGSSFILARDVPDNLILTEHKGRIWFASGESLEVWTTDGTPAGTSRLTDAGGSPLQAVHYSSTDAPPFALSDGQLVYFKAARPGEEARMWRSDGTSAGTVPLVDLPYSGDFELARAGSKTLFKVNYRLWRTDGTAAGTVQLLRSPGQPLLQYPHHLTAHAGAFYVYAEQGSLRRTLWRTDGTVEGTVALLPGFDLGSVPSPVSLGGKLFFVAADPAHGAELWVTDGTPAGTSMVADVSPGAAGSAPSGLVAAGGAVWFSAHDPAHGRELWRTDGTADGTRLVQDIGPAGASSAPEQLKVVGDRLFFSADDGVDGRELWALPLTGPGGCQPSDTALCLQGGRFRVESRWRDFQGNGGVGQAVPLTGDTGTFWFFNPSNVEVLLKVLDGRGVNDHFWVFYGALSTVEYSLTVTDTQTGLARRYSNPAGQLASVGDTQGFGPRGAWSTAPDASDALTAPPSPPALVRGWSSPAATAPCAPGLQRLCLNGGRFAVEVAWKDFQGKTGQGTTVPFTGDIADTGYFWFFDPANVELAAKVLDGRALNGKFWVFYGALSNVEYTVRVTDTQTGTVKEYRNPSGRFGSVGDTGAFQ